MKRIPEIMYEMYEELSFNLMIEKILGRYLLAFSFR
jgi:hypothetical protein